MLSAAGNSWPEATRQQSEITSMPKQDETGSMTPTTPKTRRLGRFAAKYAFNGFTLGGMFLTWSGLNQRLHGHGRYRCRKIRGLSMRVGPPWLLDGQDNWGVSAMVRPRTTSATLAYHVENPGGAADALTRTSRSRTRRFSPSLVNVNVGPSRVYVMSTRRKENLQGLDDALHLFRC